MRGRGGHFDRRGGPREDRRGPRNFDERRLGPSGAPAQQTISLVPIQIPGGPSIKPSRAPPQPAINRQKVCPLLLRIFPRLDGHHKLEDFARRGNEPKFEIHCHTWMDCTLRELCEVVQEGVEVARGPSARLSFALIYPDRSGRNIMRQIGHVHSRRHGDDDVKTLKSVGFQTGDFLSVAIHT